jgi:hypothetical protein
MNNVSIYAIHATICGRTPLYTDLVGGDDVVCTDITSRCTGPSLLQ